MENFISFRSRFLCILFFFQRRSLKDLTWAFSWNVGKLLSYFGIGILKNPETNILPSSYPFQIPFTLVYDPVLSFSRNKFPYFLISTNIFISQKFQIKIFPASDTRLRRRENQMKSKWKHDWMKMKKKKNRCNKSWYCSTFLFENKMFCKFTRTHQTWFTKWIRLMKQRSTHNLVFNFRIKAQNVYCSSNLSLLKELQMITSNN